MSKKRILIGVYGVLLFFSFVLSACDQAERGSFETQKSSSLTLDLLTTCASESTKQIVTRESAIKTSSGGDQLSYNDTNSNENVASQKSTTQKSSNYIITTTSRKSATTTKKKQATSAVPSFTKPIGVYSTKNLPSEDPYYDDLCPAWIGVYSIGKDVKIETEIKNKFKKAFGYTPTEKVECRYIGLFMVDSYKDVQKVFQYTITDLTYPLLLDEFFEVKKQICDDGSPWVGYCLPCGMDTLIKIASDARTKEAHKEMEKQFCDWVGHDMEYLREHREYFDINMISEAGKMRTKDGKVLDVVYRYMRGNNYKINKN